MNLDGNYWIFQFFKFLWFFHVRWPTYSPTFLKILSTDFKILKMAYPHIIFLLGKNQVRQTTFQILRKFKKCHQKSCLRPFPSGWPTSWHSPRITLSSMTTYRKMLYESFWVAGRYIWSTSCPEMVSEVNLVHFWNFQFFVIFWRPMTDLSCNVSQNPVDRFQNP